MANVNIKFNGKEFLLSCDDGQEEHLEELLTHINEKFNSLKNDLGNIGENKLLLITSVQIMDGYFETKKKVEQKKTELQNLSNKFRELKSLVYDFRDKKEEEMKELQQDHENFKIEIEKNKEDYEKIIEAAADEIENFVEKANLENLNIQKNQLEIEKKQIEEKYQNLESEYKALNQKLEDIKQQKIEEEKKETEFSEKIDELNQETDTLLEEIDKWQM